MLVVVMVVSECVVQVLKRGLGASAEARLPDCKAAVFGLTQLLREALYQPGPLAGQVLSALLQFLSLLYAGNCFTATTCVLRINVSSSSLSPQTAALSSQVFNCLLSLRADCSGQLGFHDDGDDSKDIKYSPFHVCTLTGGHRSAAVPQSVLQLGGVFETASACLEKVSKG